MTALGLLAIYCIAIFGIGMVNTYFNVTTMDTVKCVIFSLFIGSIIAYDLGWLFIIIVKWIMLQFGIVASTDMVYAVIYIILNLLIGILRK